MSKLEIREMAESGMPRIFLASVEWAGQALEACGLPADGLRRRTAKLGIERVRPVA